VDAGRSNRLIVPRRGGLGGALRRRRHGVGAGVALWTLALATGVVLAATPAQTWIVAAKPASMPLLTKTLVTVTVTNTSQSDAIGCIRIGVPSPAFSVLSTTITAQPAAGRVWSVTHGPGVSETVVLAKATDGGSTLRGGTFRDTVGIGVTVSGAVPGDHRWTAAAFADRSCSPPKAMTLTASLTVTVIPDPTPKPTATPISTPVPTRAASPAPAETPTPTPSAAPTLPPTPAPVETLAPTPKPALTAAPTPSALAIAWSRSAADPFAVPMGDSAPVAVDLSASMGGTSVMIEWGVPAVALSVPGLLVIAVVVAQALGGLVWLPLVRRWIGSFGVLRRRGRAGRPR